ncbi:MAG: PH domain-containing protein, partial [Flammeovirgaceae bacterium]
MIEGEEIRALTSGYCGKRTILAVCTNRRIIFLDKGLFFGMRQWQIALDRVQSIDGSYLIMFGSIRVWDGAAPIKMDMVWAKSIDPFIKAVREAVDEFRKLAFY